MSAVKLVILSKAEVIFNTYFAGFSPGISLKCNSDIRGLEGKEMGLSHC